MKTHLPISRGFTLIETFVAITILLVTVVGPMSLISRFYADTTTAKNQLTAGFLAQDGLETVSNIVRNNKLRFNDTHLYECEEESSEPALTDWLEGLRQCTETGGCNVDALTNLATEPGVMYKIATGENKSFYTAEEGAGREATIFSRTIVIEPTAESGDGDRKYLRAGKVSSTVSWSEKGKQRQMSVKLNIMENLCR